MLEVDFGGRTVLDLPSIQIHYLLGASKALARSYIAAIFEGIEMLWEFSEMGRAVDDSAGMISPGYRRFLKEDFWINNFCTARAITVWRVFYVIIVTLIRFCVFRIVRRKFN